MTADKAILYVRVSTGLQHSYGMSLDAQEQELRRFARHLGYTNIELVCEDAKSGKTLSNRSKLEDALQKLDEGSASALLVTRVDRLARSTQDFLSIIDRSERNNWRLILLDLNLDTATYQGRFVATVMAALAEMERSIMVERQKDIHRYRRETGKVWGVDLGPKTKVPIEVRELIVQYRTAGLSYGKIADRLNADGVLPVRGEKWHASAVHRLLNRLKDKRDIQEI